MMRRHARHAARRRGPPIFDGAKGVGPELKRKLIPGVAGKARIAPRRRFAMTRSVFDLGAGDATRRALHRVRKKLPIGFGERNPLSGSYGEMHAPIQNSQS